jgi:hypothetical protein
MKIDAKSTRVIEEKLNTSSGSFNQLSRITSREFRQMLQGEQESVPSKIVDNPEIYTVKEYLNQIRRLSSTRHRNTLTRRWNCD